MKPAWDRLMEDHADSSVLLVADVDCNGAGQELCDSQPLVQSYPTLLWGDANNLNKYEGDRDYEAMSSFVKAQGWECRVENLESCSAETRAEIESVLNMSSMSLHSSIGATEKQIKDSTRKLNAMKAVLASQQKDTEKASVSPKHVPKHEGCNEEEGCKKQEEVRVVDNTHYKAAMHPNDNPIEYIKHFCIYVLAPIICMVWLALCMLPIIGRKKLQKLE